MHMPRLSHTWQVVHYVYVTRTAGGALCIRHSQHSHGRRCVTYMSHPSLTQQASVTYMSLPALTRQAVRYVYVTPSTHMAGGELRICHSQHSHGRRCVMYTSHPSLTRQAVRYVYVAPVTHTAGGALCICRTRHSHSRQALRICHTRHLPRAPMDGLELGSGPWELREFVAVAKPLISSIP
jgi:hypothetical protein